MIKIPYEEILIKINEKANVPVSELEDRVHNKMHQLSGLISKEGAAHIVANELGVKIFEPLSGKLQIKNITRGMRDVETVGKVVQIYEVREFVKGDGMSKVASIVIGDETGTIRAVLWGSQADNALKLSEGGIIKVMGAYVRENNGRMELHLNDRSQLIINPKGETVKDVLFQNDSQRINNRKEIKDLQENDSDVELMGTIVQMFDIKFFEVCPKCGKRARPTAELYNCAEHGNVIPAYSYVLNAVLDDGTETIRCVFFRNQVDRLIKMNQDEVLKLRASSAEFEKIKSETLGLIVKLAGRANKNAMFNRIEFIVNNVQEANPREEMRRLESS